MTDEAPIVRNYDPPGGILNPISEDTDYADYDENFGALEALLPHNLSRKPELFAQHFGGIYIEANLQPCESTRCRHDTGTIPTQILLFFDLDGLGGFVYGHPSGDDGPVLNTEPWTREDVFLRASRTGRFGVVVI